MLAREDVSTDCNIERRKFWEMCASSAIVLLSGDEVNELGAYKMWHDHGKHYDNAAFVASFADSILNEWNKRWVVDQEEKDNVR
jgi:hypothetical protein